MVSRDLYYDLQGEGDKVVNSTAKSSQWKSPVLKKLVNISTAKGALINEPAAFLQSCESDCEINIKNKILAKLLHSVRGCAKPALLTLLTCI